MTPMIDPTIALWVMNYGLRVDRLEDWLSALESKAAEAKGRGADLVAAPEYACLPWLRWAPTDLKPTEELAWMAGEAARAEPVIADIARRHGIAVLAGTAPALVDGRPVNRARFFHADGRLEVQDKLSLTPDERDPAAWNYRPGEAIQVIRLNGLTLAILICLDIELPDLSMPLAEAGVDLVLVPSQTGRISGHGRVFGCAKARAVEIFASVVVFGSAGRAEVLGRVETAYSGAAVYVPCEEALGDTGIAAFLPPSGDAADDLGPLFIAQPPISTIRRLRAGQPEAWPGPWRGHHVRVCVPA